MSRTNEPRFAFTGLASEPPPDDFYHTEREWNALIAETARLQSRNANEDLICRRLDPVAIWAKRNGKTA